MGDTHTAASPPAPRKHRNPAPRANRERGCGIAVEKVLQNRLLGLEPLNQRADAVVKAVEPQRERFVRRGFYNAVIDRAELRARSVHDPVAQNGVPWVDSQYPHALTNSYKINLF